LPAGKLWLKLTAMIKTSKLTDEIATVIPPAIRDALGLKPGDTLVYSVTRHGVVIRRQDGAPDDDPFAAFDEWGDAEDEAAYADFKPPAG